MSTCGTYWGSHGCALPPEPEHVIHECDDCSQMRVLTTEEALWTHAGRSRPTLGGSASVRFMQRDATDADKDHWGEWSDDWNWFT